MSLLSLLLTLQSLLLPPADWLTPYEKSRGRHTATYQECLDFYSRLDQAYPTVKVLPYGSTDAGLPLHLVVLSQSQDFDPVSLRKQNKRIILIQNGIHPGEPEGIDASMMLVRDYVQNKKLQAPLQQVVLAFIALYNVDGALNRNSTSRANQDGPASYGFRGNARNLDLNRDYIKTDSRNARTFTQIFQEWQPDVFLDNHTSNGADYQHVMTLIATQKDKLQPQLRQYLTGDLLPELQAAMTKRKYPLTPYVDSKGESPDTGLIGFMDAPRYSSGYTTLFNTIGFITETHMLKPFDLRVKATYAFMTELVNIVSQDGAKIAAARQQARQESLRQQQFPLSWALDTTAVDQVLFRGYTARHKASAVSGLPRLYYDRQAPYTRSIPYYNTFRPTLLVEKPRAYVIPQAWGEVIERLQLNQVQMRTLTQDTTIRGRVYYITNYQTASQPYEGHYLHSQVQVRAEVREQTFRKGDRLIYLNQAANRYLVETLEPQGPDSFFSWGFFDAILQQKEHFSDYVFEEIAAGLLQQDPSLKQKYEQWKTQYPQEARSSQAHLAFIYRNSPYYEASHLRYPVLRIMD